MTTEQEKAIYRLNLHKDTQVQDDCCIVNAKDIEIVLSMIEKKEKIIDLMANKLALYCEINCEEDIKTNKEQIRQYFENKAST